MAVERGARIQRLTVEPTAGLANRLRVLASGMALSRRLGCPLRVIWTRTPDLRCRFADLFEPVPGIAVIERSWTASRIMRFVEARTRFDEYITQPRVERLLDSAYDFTALERARLPFIITCSRFYPSQGELARLVPRPSITSTVRACVASFTPSTVGVHVRRTDNVEAIARSPTHAFLTLMHERVRDDPATTFFVATDSRDEEQAMRQVFGDRVMARPKELSRSRPAGIRDALVDLLCLAQTSLVIGSYWSAFSEAAAELGGRPLIVVDVTRGTSSTV